MAMTLLLPLPSCNPHHPSISVQLYYTCSYPTISFFVSFLAPFSHPNLRKQAFPKVTFFFLAQTILTVEVGEALKSDMT